MKKTLVALAVAAFATSASALTVYEKDGTKFELKGKVAVKLEKSSNQRPVLKNDGSNFSFTASHTLSDDVKAIGFVEAKFEESVNTGKYYVGFDSKSAGKVTFGNQNTSTNGLDKSGTASLTTNSGKQAIVYASPSFGGFSFGAHYLLGHAEKNKLVTEAKDGYSQGFGGALKFEQKVADLTLAVNGGFTQDNYKTANGNVKRNAFIASTGLAHDKFEVGVTYTEAKASKKSNDFLKANDENLNKVAKLGVGASVVAMKEGDTKVSVYGDYEHTRGVTADKVTAKVKANKFAVGTSYQFHKQATTAVEFETLKAKVNNNSRKRDNTVSVKLSVMF